MKAIMFLVYFLLSLSIFAIIYVNGFWQRTGYFILFVMMMDILYRRYYTKYPPKSETTKSKLKGRKKKTIA